MTDGGLATQGARASSHGIDLILPEYSGLSTRASIH